MYKSQGNRPQGGQGGWKGGSDRKFGGGGGSFARRDDRGFDRPQLHQATCASCGNSCEVPFKPNGSRPIYCRECFKKEGDTDSAPMRFDRDSAPRGFDRDDKQLFQATCATCGNSCEVPFKPNGSKPVYCRNCFKKDGDSFSAPRFERKSAPESKANDQYADQFRALNVKLDMLIKALTPASSAKPAVAAPVEKTVAAAPAKAEKANPATKAEKAVKAPAKKASAKKKK